MKGRLLGFAAALAVSLTAACATLPEDPEERAEVEAFNDPIEPTNRAVYDFNTYLDSNVAEPVAEAYRDNVPNWFRMALHNLLANLQEPYTAGNDLLQGNPEAAADALGRFFINSTFGMLGTRDVVAETGGPKIHKTDLGITFGVWGFDEGPYLMLPFFGPSNLRDGAGRAADFFVSPTGEVFAAQGLGIINDVSTGVDILDTRTQHLDTLREIRRTSIDEYAAIRSLYRQFRAASLKDAQEGQPDRRAPDASAAGTASAAAAKGGAAATPSEQQGHGTPAPSDKEVKPAAVEFVDHNK